MSLDKNYESHVSETGTLIQGRRIPDAGINAGDYSDVLKFSNCKDCSVEGCFIEGGQEDAIDAVRGSNYSIRNTTILPHTNGITLKGSIDGVFIENVEIDGHGSACDIEIGQFDNYWYVGRAPTRNIAICRVNSSSGSPVVIRLWDSETPIIEKSNVRIVRIPKFIWWPYFVFRAIQTRGIKNIFKPVADTTFISTK